MSWGPQKEKYDSLLRPPRAPEAGGTNQGDRGGRNGPETDGPVGQARSATLRQMLRVVAPSCESTKSPMRGAISARNREPLNTP